MQLYHQLSGRAGREGNISTIFFQTYTPDDEVLLNISKNDPHVFLAKRTFIKKGKKTSSILSTYIFNYFWKK